ncbi:MAG: peptidylprolyl isomerase [Flavobacteriaceae bacterium]|nr:peptidylprolyl isomerase [Flavobacteriaceae bacterium]
MSQKLSCILLASLILFSSCKKSDAVPEAKSLEAIAKPVINEKEPVKVVREPDSINSKNVVAFLTKYGELHPEDKVIVKTKLGDLVVKLYDDTPLHRASFIFLTNMGYFSNTCFHRVVPGFVVQGGNSERPQALEMQNRYENYTIPPEIRPNRTHKYGALAAARDYENNPGKRSNAFEFYFIEGKKGAHHLDGEHTVFGEIVSGFPVLEKLAKLKTGRDQWPLEDVYMEIEVLK